MPPKPANPPKRKAPAFKPPRPVKAAEEAPAKAPTKRPTAAASRSAQPTKQAPSRSVFDSALLISSSDDEDDLPHGGEDSDAEDDELMEDANDDDRETVPAPQLNLIPENLLARLLYHGFDDKQTVIQKGALELTAKYMDTFVREAIARAADERKDARRGGGHMDGYLQVEDLEKLAPQLLLDF